MTRTPAILIGFVVAALAVWFWVRDPDLNGSERPNNDSDHTAPEAGESATGNGNPNDPLDRPNGGGSTPKQDGGQPATDGVPGVIGEGDDSIRTAIAEAPYDTLDAILKSLATFRNAPDADFEMVGPNDRVSFWNATVSSSLDGIGFKETLNSDGVHTVILETETGRVTVRWSGGEDDAPTGVDLIHASIDNAGRETSRISARFLRNRRGKWVLAKSWAKPNTAGTTLVWTNRPTIALPGGQHAIQAPVKPAPLDRDRFRNIFERKPDSTLRSTRNLPARGR